MPRKANGVRRGPKTWAKGSQIEFLRSRFTSWVSCTNSNLRGNLYTNVTWLFIKKYGWQLEDNDDADPDEGDIGEIREELANTGELNEQEAYQKIFKRTRSRISSYFRYHCQKTGGRKSKLSNPLSPLALFEQRHAPPRKQQVRHVYSQLHFEAHVKPSLDAEFKRLNSVGIVEPTVNTVNRITKGCWENETPQFQAGIIRIVEEMHATASATYTTFMRDMENVDFIAEALNDPTEFLQPIVDLLASKYGWAVSLLMTGPMPTENPSGPDPIRVVSVHSGAIAGLTDKLWPSFAPERFNEARHSFLEFGHAMFKRRFIPSLTPTGCSFPTNTVSPAPLESAPAPLESAPAPLESTPTPLESAPFTFNTMGPSDFVANKGPTDVLATPPPFAKDTTAHPLGSTVGTHANVTVTSPVANATAQLSLNGDGASGTAFVSTSGSTATVHISAAANPQYDATPISQTYTTPPLLPGTGPGQKNGLFIENAGIDYDFEDWTNLLGKLWPSVQEDLGPEWQLCFARFINYERRCGFEAKATFLPKGPRPVEVATWLKSGRKLDLVKLTINSLESWPERWWAWWKAYQPKERVLPDGSLSKPTKPVDDWSTLDFHGDNGILTFVIAVYCWGAKVKSDAAARTVWLEAVDDLSWCLDRLVMDGEPEDDETPSPLPTSVRVSLKRSRNGGEDDVSPCKTPAKRTKKGGQK